MLIYFFRFKKKNIYWDIFILINVMYVLEVIINFYMCIKFNIIKNILILM